MLQHKRRLCKATEMRGTVANFRKEILSRRSNFPEGSIATRVPLNLLNKRGSLNRRMLSKTSEYADRTVRKDVIGWGEMGHYTNSKCGNLPQSP